MEVLKNRYSRTLSLLDYVTLVGFSEVIHTDDKSGFKSFMETTMVGLPDNVQELKQSIKFSHYWHQDEVVQKAVQTLEKYSRPNVLILGQREVREEGVVMFNNRTLARMPNWETLLGRIGDDVMLHILVHLSLFLFVPPSSYIQVCGVPVYDLTPKPIGNVTPSNKFFSIASICYCRTGGGQLSKRHPLLQFSATNSGARKLLNIIMADSGPRRLTESRKRTPRRFIPMLALVKQILSSHKKTNTVAILGGCCPGLTPEDMGRILLKDRQVLINNTTEPWRVFLFLRKVLIKVVPCSVWGSKANQKAFLKFVRKFVKLGKLDKLNLDQLMEQIVVTDCEWAKTKKLIGHSRCHSDELKRQQMVAGFLSWIMSAYVMPLLKSAFYITETTTSRKGVVFYRKSTWSLLEKIGLQECLASGNFKPVSKGFSENTKLEDVNDVLKFLQAKTPALLASSLFGVSDAYGKWKKFALKVRNQNVSPLYFVKVDITQCYDSIPHQTLYDIMTRMLQLQHTNQIFTINRYACVTEGGSPFRRTFKKYTQINSGIPLTFGQKMQQLSQQGRLRNAVLVNQVKSRSITAEKSMAMLKKHVSGGIIKFRDKYYLRTKGIPQGSVVSSLLCNFFYAAMETECLPRISENELMMRLLDDFLIMTPHLEKAQWFLQILLNGIPKYGCHANLRKTLTNFPFIFDGNQIQTLGPEEPFPWCGLLLDTKTLNVYNDYSRYQNVSIRSTMAMDVSGDVIKKVGSKLTHGLQVKSKGFFLDNEINTLDTIQRNCYEMLLMSAYRFHSLMRSLPLKYRMGVVVTKKLLSVIFNLINKLHNLGCPLNRQETKWLCLTAFEAKLSRHQGSYWQLLKPIRTAKRKISKYTMPADMERLKLATEPALPPAFREMKL